MANPGIYVRDVDSLKQLDEKIVNSGFKMLGIDANVINYFNGVKGTLESHLNAIREELDKAREELEHAEKSESDCHSRQHRDKDGNLVPSCSIEESKANTARNNVAYWEDKHAKAKRIYEECQKEINNYNTGGHNLIDHTMREQTLKGSQLLQGIIGKLQDVLKAYQDISTYRPVKPNLMWQVFMSTTQGLKELAYLITHPYVALRNGTVIKDSNLLKDILEKFFLATQVSNISINLSDKGEKGNAIRHTLWQALLTNDPTIGKEQAERIGYVHEIGFFFNLEQRVFGTHDDADTIADLLNNQIGRSIGESSERIGNVEMARKVVDMFRDEGLWTVSKKKDGLYTIKLTKISDNDYSCMMDKLADMTESGHPVNPEAWDFVTSNNNCINGNE